MSEKKSTADKMKCNTNAFQLIEVTT